tara:strand:- start:2715 stop:2855 length:141 start_codon:yes stop_codon:yes gene_type:complete
MTGWRQKLFVGFLTIAMLALAATAMTLILIHMRPLTPDRIEVPNIQ